MVPDISEFSYGFALTREFTEFAGTALHAAPVFPSLFDEGQIGGGYDLYLDLPGLPLYLQFKRADCMQKGNAKQIQDGLGLSLPFFRFAIMNREPNDQHELLLNLDIDPNLVFYAAPRFHLIEELNTAYLENSVVTNSFFVRPRDIGIIPYERHCVAYDAYHHFICSEAREIPARNGSEMKSVLQERLSLETRSLRQGVIRETLESIERALARAEISPRQHERMGRETGTEWQINRIADLALRYFSAQFFLVQKIPPGQA